MEPLAKPSGITLADHTRHVREQVADVLRARPFLIFKYAKRTGHNLLALADACARWHDEGKRHESWQTACQRDYAAYQRTGILKGRNLQAGTVRHEFDSVARMHREPACGWLPQAARAAVAAHHGKLGFRHQKRWQDDPAFKPIWAALQLESGELQPHEPADFERAINRRYEYGGLRALLRLADRRASAVEEHTDLDTAAVPVLGEFRYQFKYDTYNGVQTLVFEFWDEPFALLRAPTGAGKTDAALLWARRQVQTGRADRLVLAMPTRFTANALHLATTETLGNTGVYHSSAWFLAKQREETQPKQADRAAWRQEMDYARLLETAATVTTIDQLCIALTATREDHHTTFWNLAHACVVIDEADFYDDFTQRNLVVLLRALYVLHVPVLLMSATLPESAKALYALSGMPIGKIWDDPTDAGRTRLQLHRAGPVEHPADIAPLLERGLRGEPLIIYANTVARAQAYWDWFRTRGMDEDRLILYHSRFTEPHKEAIERRLIALLGADAWKSGHPSGVAILTQIGELSVNVSADLMISDLCPIDRLAQRAGRLSRFKKRYDDKQDVVGELHLVEPQKTDKQGIKVPYPAPYGHYRTGTGWEESGVLRQSGQQLVAGYYSARRFVELVDELYPVVIVETTDVRNNREELENLVVQNWLLLPKAETELDDEETTQWKSRDIGPQKVVYADTDFSIFALEGDSRDFRGAFAFREWALPHSITIPVYDFQRARKTEKLEAVTVRINEETETIYVVKQRFYDKLQGLRFDQKISTENEF